MPTVAIYIPTYNADALIEPTLFSCLEQTIKDWHVYVVDNASSDTTLAKIDAFITTHDAKDKVSIIKNTTNLGRIGNWNKCLELFCASNHDFLKFLFTGDRLLPHCLETQLHIFASNKKSLGLVTCGTIIEKEGRSYYAARIHKEGSIPSAQGLRYAVERGCWFGSSVSCGLVKKESAVATFDPLYAWAADFKFGVDIVANCDAYFITDGLTVFNYSSRKFYSTQVTKLRSRVELQMIRYHALDLLRAANTLAQPELAKLEAGLELGDELVPLAHMPAMARRKVQQYLIKIMAKGGPL